MLAWQPRNFLHRIRIRHGSSSRIRRKHILVSPRLLPVSQSVLPRIWAPTPRQMRPVHRYELREKDQPFDSSNSAAERGVRVALNDSVSLSPEGVFDRTQKVAELMQVVERIGAQEIAGITGGKSAGRRVGCGLVAWFGGGIAGGMIGGLIGALLSPHSHDQFPASFVIGLVAGEAAGIAFVWHKCWSTGTRTIYSAP